MEKYLTIFFSVLCFVHLGEQRANVSSSCADYTEEVDKLKDQCVQLLCDVYGVEKLDCDHLPDNCGPYYSVAEVKQNDEVPFPDCCPVSVCQFDFVKSVKYMFG